MSEYKVETNEACNDSLNHDLDFISNAVCNQQQIDINCIMNPSHKVTSLCLELIDLSVQIKNLELEKNYLTVLPNNDDSNIENRKKKFYDSHIKNKRLDFEKYKDNKYVMFLTGYFSYHFEKYEDFPDMRKDHIHTIKSFEMGCVYGINHIVNVLLVSNLAKSHKITQEDFDEIFNLLNSLSADRLEELSKIRKHKISLSCMMFKLLVSKSKRIEQLENDILNH